MTTESLADLYLRLSLDHPGATAIERQEDECRRWCAANGLTVRQVHVDRGVSGFSERSQHKRDGFVAALGALASGEITTLVVWKLDRLSRRGVGQVGPLLDDLERLGGRLVSVRDMLDTWQPQSRMLIALLSEFARAESETMGVRTRSVMEAKRAKGEWLTGKPPYGYEMAEDKHLRPVEPAASAMRHVFEMVIAGHSLYAVCAYLNDRGLRNARGQQFTTTAVSGALRTPAYSGLQPARHVNAKGAHAAGVPGLYYDRDSGEPVSCLTPGAEPIVTRDQQLLAQRILLNRQRQYGRGRAPKRPAYALLLQGLGRCDSCGRPLLTNNGYRCFPLDRNGTLACTRPVRAMVEPVDRRVTATWVNLVCRGVGPEADRLRCLLAERWLPMPPKPSSWQKLRTELRTLQGRLDDVDSAYYVHGELDSRRHGTLAAELSLRIGRTQTALGRMQPDVDTSALFDEQFVRARWDEHIANGRRELLRLAWAEIRVAKAGRSGERFRDERITYIPHTDNGPVETESDHVVRCVPATGCGFAATRPARDG